MEEEVKSDPEIDAGEEYEGGTNGSTSNGGQASRSIAERLFSTGTRGAQRFADLSGLDQAIESAVEEAIVRAIESEATENAIARLINGPVIEQAVKEAVASKSVEQAVIDVLDSEMTERIWTHILDGPLTQEVIERIAEAPEVRAAIAAQGIGLIGDIGHQVSVVTRALDFIGEKISRKLLFRPGRVTPTNRAGFFTRALGIGIDALLVNLTLITFAAVFGVIASGLGVSNSGDHTNLIAVGGLLWFAVSSLYLFIFWSLSGQTPGMRFLDIRIETDGDPRIGPRRAGRRLLGFWFSAAILGLGFIGALVRLDRRGLLDRFGETTVYFIDPVKPEQPHVGPVLDDAPTN
ncbi:MAG: RDD family protein [Solirubrobacterales bacterium]